MAEFSRAGMIATDFAKDGETEGEVIRNLLDGMLTIIWTFCPGNIPSEVDPQQLEFMQSKIQIQAS